MSIINWGEIYYNTLRDLFENLFLSLAQFIPHSGATLEGSDEHQCLLV